MSLIDLSYFVGNLNIPNTDKQEVADTVNWFIQKYEPDFLLTLLGYPLYKALITALNNAATTTPDQRFIDLLYGAEYVDYYGYTKKWDGIIKTDSPVFNLTGGFVYKPTQNMTADITPGFFSGVASFTMDGTNGTDDWRGWTPIVTRTAPLFPDVDYSWAPIAGFFVLLSPGDLFAPMEKLRVQFELRTDSGASDGLSAFRNQSPIADYVYYWYMRNASTLTTGAGEFRHQGDNAIAVSPRQKMLSAWNEMSRWSENCYWFLYQSQTTYTEWNYFDAQRAYKSLKFINPIF